MARRGIVCHHLFRVEAEDADIVLAIQHNEFVGAELQRSDRGRPRRSKSHADSFLPEDVDKARTELGFVCADREEGLDGIVGKDRDLRINAVAGELSHC